MVHVEERPKGDVIYRDLILEEGDKALVTFNYLTPISGDGVSTKTGNPYKWFMWSVNWNENERLALFMYDEKFSNKIGSLLDEIGANADDVSTFEFIVSRPRTKNQKTKRFYTTWDIEPVVEGQVKIVSEEIIEETLEGEYSEFADDSLFDEDEADPTLLNLSSKEFKILNRDLVYKKPFGEEKIKKFLTDNGISDERAEVLVDALVDDDGFVSKDLVLKYGG